MPTMTTIERSRAWRAANPDKVRAQYERRKARLRLRPRKITAAERAAYRRRSRAWRKANPDRVAAQVARRKARRQSRGILGSIHLHATCDVCQSTAKLIWWRDRARIVPICRRCALAARACGDAGRAARLAEWLMLG